MIETKTAKTEIPQAPTSEQAEKHKCYAYFRTDPEQNDGKEFLHYAMWHNETRPDKGERIVEGYFIAASGGEAPAERARFESALPKFLSRETFVDDEGDVVYADEWIQGAWAGWMMALASKSQKGAA